MKTNQLKNQVKLGTLLFTVVLLFFSCEKELFEEQKNNSGFIVKKIYSKDISNNRLLNETLSKIQKSNTNNESYRTIYNNEHNFYIETDQATYIENGEYHSYTFLIYRDSQTNLTENLLLSLQSDLTYKAFIVSYNFTEAEKQMVANGDYVSLTDKTTFTPLENFDTNEITNELSSKIYYNASLGYCYELVEETSSATGWTILVENEVPCPEDGEPNDSEIDAGDSSTGGGTGTDNGFPESNDDASSSGGGTSDSSGSTSDDSSNPPDDGENCLLDSNGNCIGNATKPEVEPEESTNVCDELNKISTNFGTKNALVDLSVNTNQVNEKGYALKQNPSTGNYETPEATVNSTVSTSGTNANIPMQNYLGNNYIGIFHTHPRASDGWIPMFSTGDINVLFYLATYHNNTQKKYSEYIITLTVPDGAYALKIKDWQKFSYARNNKWNGRKGIKTKLEDAYKNRDSEGDIILLEKDILDLFKEFDMGIGLYKANDDLTEWSELIHDLNPLSPNFGYSKSVPCN